MIADLRRSTRYADFLPITVTVGSGHDETVLAGPFPARIVDISNHGVSLLLTQVMLHSASRTRPSCRSDCGPMLAVVYLVFNEGHTATSGERLFREELCREALRLGRLLAEVLPEEPEVLGLLALMLLVDTRRAGRVTPAGDLVRLAEQDRSRWDRALIAEGRPRRHGPTRRRSPSARTRRSANSCGGGFGRWRPPDGLRVLWRGLLSQERCFGGVSSGARGHPRAAAGPSSSPGG